MKDKRLIALFLLLILFVEGCKPAPDYKTVQLNISPHDVIVPAEQVSSKVPLRVAVAAVISPKATFETYSPLLDYLSKQLGRPVELLQRSTYADINELIRIGQADIGFVCGGAFVEGEREGYMELLALPQIDRKITYQAFIIVPADSQAKTLDDLRGKRFAFTDPLSNSGHLYVQFRLAKQGFSSESYFSDTIYTYSHDNSIHAVADGIVDGATVDSLVYNSLLKTEPELAVSLRIIEQSQPMGIPPVVVHPDLDEDLKATLQQVLTQMHIDPEGKRALAVLSVEKFVEPDNRAYDDIRNMAAFVRGW